MYVYIESKVYIAGVKYILHKEHPINKKNKLCQRLNLFEN